MKKAVTSACSLGADGITDRLRGTAGRSEIARREWYRERTRAASHAAPDIDFGMATAHTDRRHHPA